MGADEELAGDTGAGGAHGARRSSMETGICALGQRSILPMMSEAMTSRCAGRPRVARTRLSLPAGRLAPNDANTCGMVRGHTRGLRNVEMRTWRGRTWRASASWRGTPNMPGSRIVWGLRRCCSMCWVCLRAGESEEHAYAGLCMTSGASGSWRLSAWGEMLLDWITQSVSSSCGLWIQGVCGVGRWASWWRRCVPGANTAWV